MEDRQHKEMGVTGNQWPSLAPEIAFAQAIEYGV